MLKDNTSRNFVNELINEQGSMQTHQKKTGVRSDGRVGQFVRRPQSR